MSNPPAQILKLRKIAQGNNITLRRWAIIQLSKLDPEWLVEQRLAPPTPPEAPKTPSSRPATASEANSGVSEAIGEKTGDLLSAVYSLTNQWRNVGQDDMDSFVTALEDAALRLTEVIKSAKYDIPT